MQPNSETNWKTWHSPVAMQNNPELEQPEDDLWHPDETGFLVCFDEAALLEAEAWDRIMQYVYEETLSIATHFLLHLEDLGLIPDTYDEEILKSKNETEDVFV